MVFPKWKWELIWLVLGHGSLQLVTRSLQVSSCGAHSAKTEHLWWVTTITDPCFPHAFHSSDQTFQPIKGLREHAVLLQTHSFSCPVVEFCLFTCSTNVCTVGFYIFIRLLFFMHLDYHSFHLWFCFWYYIFQQAQVFALQCLLFLEYEF